MAVQKIEQADFQRIAIADVEPEPYRTILQAWCSQRGTERFPPLEKIDPFVVPALAGNLLLLEVAGETLTYRVLGDDVVTAVGTNLKGKTMREAFGDTEYVQVIEHQLLSCATSGTPIYSCHDFQLPGTTADGTSSHRKAWRIALPYGNAERVTRLLCYQLFSRTIEVSYRKSIDFAKLIPTTVFRIEV